MTALERPRYPMPDYVEHALIERGLVESYGKRPEYQPGRRQG